MERHDAGEARVIPIILHAVDWEGAPFSKLKALPTDAFPVSNRKWTNNHEAFADVAKGIRTAINGLNAIHSNRRHKSKIWNIPHRENPNFTGREDLLARLRDSLISNQHAALTQAIHGLGGVGKTQLAVEYAYRHEQDYALVWWVRAEEAATLAADYAALAGELNLPEKSAKDQRTIIEAVRRYLEQNKNWLFIFDNAGNQAEVFEYLPRTSLGHVIITSRNPNWRGTASPLPVQVMEPSEAIDFLNKRTGHTDKIGAASLAETLGYLPLALEQAGAYIEQSTISYDEYLELFREYQHDLLKEGTPSLDYPDTVATTWNISFQQVQEASPEGANLLNLCAYLAPDDIPIELIQEGAPHLPESLARAVANPLLFNKTIAVLRCYSLVEREGDTLSVHRLVQVVTRDRMDEDAKKTWAETALRLIDDAFPSNITTDMRSWPICSRLLPHALDVDKHCRALNMILESAGSLLKQVGLYLQVRAKFVEAKEVFQRALRIDEEAYGSDHPEVATDVNLIGYVLELLGDLKGAKEHYERALKIGEEAYGANHPKVAIWVNNLGGALQSLGDLKGAKEHYERALKIDTMAYGPDHLSVARDVNNLGSVLESLGDLKGAKEHYERALKIDTVAYGSDHLSVARDVNNLGHVLESLGDLKGAKKHYVRALRIFTKYLGEDHPNTKIVKNNLEILESSKN